MDIHRYEKVWAVASVALIVAFIGTVTFGAVGPGITMVSDAGGTVDPGSPIASENFREPGTYRVGEDHYAVYVLARQFAFQPGSTDPIRVPANSTVTFHVTSGDVVHGFQLVGTNVNVMVIPGQVSQLTVEFDGPRTYGLLCNEYCGAGHHRMAGTVAVVPSDAFNATAGGV